MNDAERSFYNWLSKAASLGGCTKAQVDALESTFGVTLPDDYRAFLLSAGYGIAGHWPGEDSRYGRLLSLQEEWLELLDEAGIPRPEGAFVFLSHQGYIIYMLLPDGVYGYAERDIEIKKVAGSFSQFVMETLDW